MKNLFKKNNDNDVFGSDADGNRRGQRQCCHYNGRRFYG